ncbi:MAG: MBL fold metallo-hydrolase [Spirochaetota bacterium]
MLKYGILGSGSSANSYIFQLDNFAFIIDNGFSCREFFQRAESLGFNPKKIKAIFLTHLHRDHVGGVEALSRKLEVPVVMHSQLNIGKHICKDLYGRIDIVPFKEITFQALSVTAFATSHDSACSISYHFTLGNKSFTLITDTGVLSPIMEKFALTSDVLFLEANYNYDMLINGSYPDFLKKRILSDYGHLSNQDAITFLNNLANGTNANRLKIVYFCHMSDNNNSPGKLQEEIDLNLRWKCDYIICPKGHLQAGINL